MVLFLCSFRHTISLYGVNDVAVALKTATDVDVNSAIKNGIDSMLLIHEFDNNAADKYGLSYNEHVCESGDRNLLYVRRGTISGQKGRKNRTIMFGRFGSMEVAKRANVVR